MQRVRYFLSWVEEFGAQRRGVSEVEWVLFGLKGGLDRLPSVVVSFDFLNVGFLSFSPFFRVWWKLVTVME